MCPFKSANFTNFHYNYLSMPIIDPTYWLLSCHKNILKENNKGPNGAWQISLQFRRSWLSLSRTSVSTIQWYPRSHTPWNIQQQKLKTLGHPHPPPPDWLTSYREVLEQKPFPYISRTSKWWTEVITKSIKRTHDLRPCQQFHTDRSPVHRMMELIGTRPLL